MEPANPKGTANAWLGVCSLRILALAFLCSIAATPAFAQCTRNCGTTPGQTPHFGSTPTSTPTPTAGSASCTTDSTLCLSEGRFLITAIWTKPDGESGPAHAAALTADSGYFWFFDPANVEVTLKTLNGCGVNGRYWFFAGGLTNLQVDISVTDTTTNTTKKYSNTQGSAFPLITDTSTFASCSAVESGFSPDPEDLSDKSTLRPLALPAHAKPDTEPGCLTTDTVLCANGRFQITANWQTASGESGAAHAVQLTPEAGYFWFFDPANVELVVKSLDACSIGRGNWFFGTGLTTVDVQLDVIDTFTGESRHYANALGTRFKPIQETSAFSFCPTPTPSPITSATPVPTFTLTPTSVVSIPTLTPTRGEPTRSARPTRSATPTLTRTAMPTITLTATITPTPTITPTATITPTPTATPTGSYITGGVRAYCGIDCVGPPLRGAAIRVTQGSVVKTTITDYFGGYHVDGFQPGSATVAAAHSGYLPQSRSVVLVLGRNSVGFILRPI
jgi:hypothetical protein